MQEIIYYISGHGYGHTTRSLELIRTLQRKNAHLFFHIRTDAPEWMFKLNLNSNYRLHRFKMDIGAVQKTSFHIDKKETFRQVAELYEQKDRIIEREVAFVEARQARLILSDIPPLAFDVAQATQIPGVGLTNFSWDWIYRPYVKEIPEFSKLIEQIAASYNKASLLLRLPFYGNLSSFPKFKDIPLIARKAERPKEEILNLLGVSANNKTKSVLVALRASDLEQVIFEKISTLRNFKFVTMGLPQSYENCINLSSDFIRFPELVNACDLVVSKPGYGLVSEILAHRTPLLYTSRDDFIEYHVLAQGLEEYAVCKFLPREDFLKGNWQPYLNALCNGKQSWKEIALNGADVAAEEVLKLI